MAFILRRLSPMGVLFLLSLVCGISIVEGYNFSTTAATNWNGTFNATHIAGTANQAHGNATLSLNTTTPTSFAITTLSTADPIATCDGKWAAWYRSSILAYTPVAEQTFTKVVISTETSYQTTYTCSSTCGDVCYANVKTLATDYSTITSTSYSTSTKWNHYNGTTPGCDIPSASCTSLWDVFSASTSVWNSWYFADGPADAEPPWPREPGCKFCRQTRCYVIGSGQVQIYYWPEDDSVTRDMCTDFPARASAAPLQNSNYLNTSFIPVTTGPSVVIDGRTFYQGNAYLSVEGAYATDNCGSTLGKVHSDIMLTLASSNLYSIRADVNTVAEVFPVNYADLQAPYPWSAYKGALHDCASGMNFNTGPWCAKSVVFEDNYHPIINLPIQISKIDPAWEGCMPIVAMLDPPVALTPADVALTNEWQPPVVLHTAAAPVSTPTPVAIQTASVEPGRNGEQPGGAGQVESPRPAATAAGQGSGPTAAAPHVTIGPTVIPLAPNGDGLVIQPGVTLSRGGSPAMIDGTSVHIGDDYSVTFNSPSGISSAAVPRPGSDSSITVGSRTLTFDSQGNLASPGTTLQQDDPPVTLASGQVVSVSAQGITIIDPQTGKIQYIPYADLKSGNTMVTIGAQSYTVDASGNLVLGAGKTLHLGDPAVTISGTVVSVGTAGIVLGDSHGGTKTLSKVTAVNTNGEQVTTQKPGLRTQPAQEHAGTDAVIGAAQPTSSKKGSASGTGPIPLTMILCSLLAGSWLGFLR